MSEREPLHVHLSPKASQALRDAMEVEGVSKTDLVSRAIQTYAWMVGQQALGAEILVHRSDGSAERVHFL